MKGLTLLPNYTWSRMLERWGFQDPFNRITQRSLYFNDRPHVFKLTTVYELPFGRGQQFFSGVSKLANYFVGGWQTSAFFQWASGEPADYGASIRPLRDSTVKDIKWDSHQVRGFGNCVVRQNEDGSLTPMPYSVTAGCGTDISKYDWLWVANNSLGGANTVGRQTPFRQGQLRKHAVPTLDLSLFKNLQFTERLRAQLGFEAFNAINKYYFGRNDTFNNNPNDPNFGTLFPSLTSNQNFSPRTMQVRFKFYW
jgi:hypothetical protein